MNGSLSKATAILVVSLMPLGAALGQQTVGGPSSIGAPMGLQWGASRQAVEETGASLTPTDIEPGEADFIARNLPKTLSDAELVVLQFGADDRLWRIAVKSKEWSNDDYGVQVKGRFAQLAKLIDERYGQGRDFNRETTDDVYKDAERFAFALSRNKIAHGRVWTKPDLEIELRAGAQYNDTYYILIYEYMPIAQSVKQQRRAREKDAL